MSPFTPRIRSLRKQYELSQAEFARLLGLAQSAASRLESGETQPDLETALSVELIFGRRISELFPDLYAKVEDVVMRRAAELDRGLQKLNLSERSQKRRLLRGMALRVKANWHGV